MSCTAWHGVEGCSSLCGFWLAQHCLAHKTGCLLSHPRWDTAALTKLSFWQKQCPKQVQASARQQSSLTCRKTPLVAGHDSLMYSVLQAICRW